MCRDIENIYVQQYYFQFLSRRPKFENHCLSEPFDVHREQFKQKKFHKKLRRFMTKIGKKIYF